MIYKTKISRRIITMALSAIFLLGAFTEHGINASANVKDLNKATRCTFLVPEGFIPSSTPGLWVNEHYPLESANVTYKVTAIPQDRVLTNAEKAKGEKTDTSEVEILYDELTQDMYKEIQEQNYKDIYGDNISFNVESFDSNLLDGFPSYVIKSSFTPENSQTIHQTAYIILSSNKIFTLVYSRADDDYFEETFAESMASIHVK